MVTGLADISPVKKDALGHPFGVMGKLEAKKIVEKRCKRFFFEEIIISAVFTV